MRRLFTGASVDRISRFAQSQDTDTSSKVVTGGTRTEREREREFKKALGGLRDSYHLCPETLDIALPPH